MNKAHKIMITLLLELKSDMRDLRSQLSDITGLLNHQPSSTLTGGSSTLNFMLPLKTKDELKNFEERLAKDNTLRQNVVNYSFVIPLLAYFVIVRFNISLKILVALNSHAFPSAVSLQQGCMLEVLYKKRFILDQELEKYKHSLNCPNMCYPNWYSTFI